MTNSLRPKAEKIFRICHRIGWPPISTIGFGLVSVSSDRRVPNPPARITTFPTIDAPICLKLRPEAYVTSFRSPRRIRLVSLQRYYPYHPSNPEPKSTSEAVRL